MNPIRILARGTVKNVWLVEWNHQPLVMSTLTMTEYKEDFQANVENLLRFRMNKNPFIQEFLLTLVIFNIITRLHVFGDVV